MDFKQLHHQDKPLLICNVWNTDSALQAEKLGFAAIGTSSAAIAHSLGYEDGEGMAFSELKFVVEKIAKRVSIPLSVDIESGYSRNEGEVLDNILELSALGVSGINIEDSIVCDGERVLLPSDKFTALLKYLKEGLQGQRKSMFINVRTDPYLIGVAKPLEITTMRITEYQTAGVDGFFVPCVVDLDDIKRLVATTSLPLNVLAMPGLADFETLGELGVKRLSMGNWLHDKLNRQFTDSLKRIQQNGNFSELFS